MRAVFCLFLSLCSICAACIHFPNALSSTPVVSGVRAMEHVRAQVALGPRPPGSEAHRRCREFIRRHLEGLGYRVEDDSFTAATPYGPIEMHNLIAGMGEPDEEFIALATHYDTKRMERVEFVGANDGGSSTGLLLELASVLAECENRPNVKYLFLDGEEALVRWSTFDGTYGSRHLARRWKQEGVVDKCRALILLDMVGDKDLDIARDSNSTRWLSDLVWQTAIDLDLEDILSPVVTAIEDDHVPFLDVGISSVDIIDFNYGPGNSYWHTEEDTLDKVSVESLEKIGKVVLALLQKLQERFSTR